MLLSTFLAYDFQLYYSLSKFLFLTEDDGSLSSNGRNSIKPDMSRAVRKLQIPKSSLVPLRQSSGHQRRGKAILSALLGIYFAYSERNKCQINYNLTWLLFTICRGKETIALVVSTIGRSDNFLFSDFFFFFPKSLVSESPQDKIVGQRFKMAMIHKISFLWSSHFSFIYAQLAIYY